LDRLCDYARRLLRILQELGKLAHIAVAKPARLREFINVQNPFTADLLEFVIN